MQAELLQELDGRERNLRLLEVQSLHLFLEEIVYLLTHLLPVNAETLQKYQSVTRERFQAIMAAYEPELYQDRYLPEHQRKVQEDSRRKKEQELRSIEEQNRRVDFVKNLGETRDK